MEGMETPSAGEERKKKTKVSLNSRDDEGRKRRREGRRDGRFRNLIAPSRHSGESSLSPKDPRSSETMISAGSGTSMVRMSPKMISTEDPHSRA